MFSDHEVLQSFMKEVEESILEVPDISRDEFYALIDCVNTREDEGFDVSVARSALRKLADRIAERKLNARYQ